MAEKRYYWMKLKEDFFSSNRIKKLRKLAGGDTYTIIYLKMQLKSLKNDGYLYFTGLENDFCEELALDIDEDVENVRVTVQYLMKVGLLEPNENMTEYLMPYVLENVGSDTANALRVRDYRKRKKEESITNVQQMKCECNASVMEATWKRNVEIEIEKDIEKEKELEIELDNTSAQSQTANVEAIPLNDGSEWKPNIELYEEYVRLYPAVNIEQEFRNMRAWSLNNPSKKKTRKGITRFVNGWLQRSQDKPATQGKSYMDAIHDRVSEVDRW